MLPSRSLRPYTFRALLAGLLTALALAACGPSSAITLQVGDAGLEVVLGGSATTEVTITRSGGATAAVTLDADGAPDWVSVTFSPATLTGDTLTSTMTVHTDAGHADAEPTTFTLTVSGTGSGLNASDELEVEVTLLTVTGRITGLYGETQPGYLVSVNGGTPVPADSLGNFTVPNVTVPYDLYVVNPDESVGHVYMGLTTTDLLLPEPPGGTAYSTTVSGDLSEMVGIDQVAVVCFEGATRPVTGCEQVSAGNTSYSFDVTWYGVASTSGHLHAWLVDLDDDGLPSGYPKEGRTALNISDGVPVLADVNLEAGPDTRSIAVDVTPPPGLAMFGSAVALSYSDFASMAVSTAMSTDTSFTALVPDVAGARYTLVAQAGVGEVQAIAWEVGGPDTEAIEVTMSPTVAVIGPAAGVTGVNHDTVFSISNPLGTAVTYLFTGSVGYYVTTADTAVTIPDLSAFGIDLPSGADYTWAVVSMPHLPTVDDLAREGWISSLANLQATLTGGPGPDSGGELAVAGYRAFTTE